MKAFALRAAKWVAYPAFYLFCLGLFGYLTFPYGRLKDRVIAEFERKGKPGQRLEIKGLTSYWFTGVELTGVKVTMPADDASASPSSLPGLGRDDASGGSSSKDTVINVDEVHARVQILPLLIGRVRVDFWAKVFDGEIKGSVPVGAGGDVEIVVDKVDIGQIEPLTHAIGLPVKGLASGKLALSAPDGKFNKATGTLELTISDVIVSDGKTKVQGLIELPAAKVGDLTLVAEAKDPGALRISKMTAQGTDLELTGDGKISVREPWGDSGADLYLRFKFTDAYRGKNATTKTLLGDPGSANGGLMEMQVPKMKRAKRLDGFYGWHVHGPLKRLKFDPSSTDVGPGTGKRTTKATDGTGAKKIGGLTFPLGTAQRPQDQDKDDAPTPPTPAAPVPPGMPAGAPGAPGMPPAVPGMPAGAPGMPAGAPGSMPALPPGFPSPPGRTLDPPPDRRPAEPIPPPVPTPAPQVPEAPPNQPDPQAPADPQAPENLP